MFQLVIEIDYNQFYTTKTTYTLYFFSYDSYINYWFE